PGTRPPDRAGRSVRSRGRASYTEVMADVYQLFQQGTALLEAGDHHQAAIPLRRARDLAPDKASIREALGRALFHAQRYQEAADEFAAVVEQAPTNDFAL